MIFYKIKYRYNKKKINSLKYKYDITFLNIKQELL